jgi:hypothetical protein
MSNPESKMVITRLLLVNYTRMSLAGIKRFLYTPDLLYILQMVLGTNGSGKSSLMNEMWPLPADKDDFGINGRKEIDIQYNGKFYELSSSFEGPKPHHSFMCDGVEMNGDGKIEMYRALVEEHFHITNEIRALALGKELLTTMSPGRRRYWLVRLADTDFTYAMSIYKKLQEAHRDAQGAIKRLQKRLVDERIKLADANVIKTLNNEVYDIKALIGEIYDMRNAEAKKGPEVLQVLESNWHDLDRYGNEIDRLNTELITSSGHDNHQDLLDCRDVIKIEIAAAQQMQQHLYTEHSRVKKKYDMLVKAGTESLAELQAKVTTAKETIAYEETFIALPNVRIEFDAVQMAATLKEIYHELYDKISSLPSNDGVYTREKAEMAQARLTQHSGQYTALQARISRLNADIEHRRDHVQKDSITCPQCSHSWTTKASEDDIKKAETVLAQLKEDSDNLVQRISDESKYMAEYTEYADAYRNVINMMRSAPNLRAYFNEITQNNRLIQYPGSVAAELYTMQSDIEHQVEIAKQKKILESAQEQIELKKNLDADTLESIETEMSGIEEKMGVQTRKLKGLTEELADVENLIQQSNRVAALHEKMLSAHGVHQDHIKGYVYSRFQEALWQLILSLQTQLARKEDALAQLTSQQQIVDEIQYQLDEAIMNERVAKMAHIALSPTSGAIAEGLHRFVNVFVSRMNRVVGSVWSYPLEILPFIMEDGQADMDYKFPFAMNKGEKPKKDVNEGSESIVDIFNFAFRICALRQLGLGHIPLFLDEFEAAFDDVHRERAIYFIKKLIDEDAYGQIFMVSHYESNHGALSSLAQTCVLSTDNLMLPSNTVFNEHVTLN